MKNDYTIKHLSDDVKVLDEGSTVPRLYGTVTRQESDREVMFDEDYGFTELQLLTILEHRLSRRVVDTRDHDKLLCIWKHLNSALKIAQQWHKKI